MMTPVKSLLVGCALVAAGLFPIAGHAASDRPIVVELFTSQGCSSCPPADELLGELAKQPGVLALAWHVDYWDGLGWKDQFSNHEWTNRQYDYAERLGSGGQVYTPQLVIDGDSEAVGSDGPEAARLINAANRRAVQGPPLTVGHRADGTEAISVGAGKGAGQVWLVAYDAHHVTSIGRGENSGRSLTEYQVVRNAVTLGTWQGAPLELALPAKSAESEVVFIEPDAPGPILAALKLDR